MRYSKYRAIKTMSDGHTFDSRLEAKRYAQLKLMERAGAIKNVKCQVPFVLIEKNENGRAIKYVADFVYEENGQMVVEDTKGIKTPVYRLKKRLMQEKYGITIKEVYK